MTRSEESPKPASPWRPDLVEPVVLLAGSLALLAVLGWRVHPFSKALGASVAWGGLLSLAVYGVRCAGLLIRRLSDPETSREFASGLALGSGLVILAVIVALIQVPPDLDRATFMAELKARQTLALMGKDLPPLEFTERHYREALPIMELAHAQAERTRQASADFQRTAQYMKDPLNPRSLSSEEGRKEARTRLSNLKSTGEAMEQEALRLVGPEFLEKLQALPVPASLKVDVAQATSQNHQFADCLEWIRVNRKLVDDLDHAYTLAEKHLLLPKGQPPLWDGQAPRDAFVKIGGEYEKLVAQAETLRQRTMVQVVEVAR
ncbi:MAG TPA: hypothetical protein VJ600_06850 [Holophagaceae bacterium]|nr:hypothetical protein [Holophagaceae bacterium]